MTNQSVDLNVLLDIQHRNIEAFTQAQRLALEGFMTAWLRQTETLAQIASLTSALVTKNADGQTPAAKMENWADMAKQIYGSSLTNWTGQNAAIGQSGKAAADVIHNRMNSSLDELQHALKKRTRSHGHNGHHSRGKAA